MNLDQWLYAHAPMLEGVPTEALRKAWIDSATARDIAHERRLRAMHALLCVGAGALTFEEWVAGIDDAIAARGQTDLFSAGAAAPVREKSPRRMRAGFARAASLSPERRREIASIASAAAARKREAATATTKGAT